MFKDRFHATMVFVIKWPILGFPLTVVLVSLFVFLLCVIETFKRIWRGDKI